MPKTRADGWEFESLGETIWDNQRTSRRASGHRAYPQAVHHDTHGDETAVSGQGAFLNTIEGTDARVLPRLSGALLCQGSLG